MKTEELLWLNKYIKNVNIIKRLSEKSDDFIEILMNYISLCSGNINIDIINKMIGCETEKKAELIARVASNKNFMSSKRRTYEEKMYLLDKIKNSSTDFNAAYIAKVACNFSVNKRRTFSEQIELIDKIDGVEKEDISKAVYILSVNSNVLKRRSSNEQLQMMDIIKSIDMSVGSIHIQNISTSAFVLKNYSFKEQLQFINKMLACDTDEKLIHMSNYIDLEQKRRTFSEKIDVLDYILNSKTEQMARYIKYVASNPILLFYLNGKNHNKLLKKISLTQTEEKSRTMTLAVLNQYKVTNEDIEKMLSVMEQINLLDDDSNKVLCMIGFLCKSDFFYRSDYEQQGKLIDIINGSAEECINDFIDMLEYYRPNIPAKIILSSKEFGLQRKSEQSLYETLKKYCEYEKIVKVKRFYEKRN